MSCPFLFCFFPRPFLFRPSFLDQPLKLYCAKDKLGVRILSLTSHISAGSEGSAAAVSPSLVRFGPPPPPLPSVKKRQGSPRPPLRKRPGPPLARVVLRPPSLTRRAAYANATNEQQADELPISPGDVLVAANGTFILTSPVQLAARALAPVHGLVSLVIAAGRSIDALFCAEDVDVAAADARIVEETPTEARLSAMLPPWVRVSKTDSAWNVIRPNTAPGGPAIPSFRELENLGFTNDWQLPLRLLPDELFIQPGERSLSCPSSSLVTKDGCLLGLQRGPELHHRADL